MNITTAFVFMAAMFGCASDGPVAVREGLRFTHSGRHFGRQVIVRFKTMLRHRPPHQPCPPKRERRRQVLATFSSLDVFANSTLHEEPDLWRR